MTVLFTTEVQVPYGGPRANVPLSVYESVAESVLPGAARTAVGWDRSPATGDKKYPIIY